MENKMENEMETGGILDLLTIVVSLIIGIPVSKKNESRQTALDIILER